MERQSLEKLLKTEDDQLEKLNSIVVKAIEEEKLLSHKLMEFEDPHLPFSSRMADRVASFGGSWQFIIFFLVAMLAWIALHEKLDLPMAEQMKTLFEIQKEQMSIMDEIKIAI